MNYFMFFLLSIPGIIVATTAHEFTRAVVSTALGDTLPKSKGRLTLNPFKHFEPIGFLLLFYSGGFGWGKPVETSALYYQDRKRDTLLVAIMPSVVNLLLGILFVALYQGFADTNFYLSGMLYYFCFYNVGLAVYNLLPVSPMDCVKALSVLMPANKYFNYLQYEKMIQMIFLFLLFLGVFSGLLGGIVNFIIQFFAGLFFFL